MGWLVSFHQRGSLGTRQRLLQERRHVAATPGLLGRREPPPHTACAGGRLAGPLLSARGSHSPDRGPDLPACAGGLGPAGRGQVRRPALGVHGPGSRRPPARLVHRARAHPANVAAPRGCEEENRGGYDLVTGRVVSVQHGWLEVLPTLMMMMCN